MPTSCRRPDFLKRTVPVLMADDELAFVQARWEHLNAGENMLTRAQAVMLDAHFGVEQSVRFADRHDPAVQRHLRRLAARCDRRRRRLDGRYADRGPGPLRSAPIWRAGGRRYLPQVTAAGELPTTLAAWRTQQHRWNKGFAQVARKLLPSVWRSDMPPLFKLALTLEVGQSLFCPLAALCLTTSLSLLWLNAGQQPLALSLLGLIATAMGVFSATTFVTLGQLALGRYPERHSAEHPGGDDADVWFDPVELPRGVRSGDGQAVAVRADAEDGRHGHCAGG